VVFQVLAVLQDLQVLQEQQVLVEKVQYQELQDQVVLQVLLELLVKAN
jgi:phage pi2 protein 07